MSLIHFSFVAEGEKKKKNFCCLSVQLRATQIFFFFLFSSLLICLDLPGQTYVDYFMNLIITPRARQQKQLKIRKKAAHEAHKVS